VAPRRTAQPPPDEPPAPEPEAAPAAEPPAKPATRRAATRKPAAKPRRRAPARAKEPEPPSDVQAVVFTLGGDEYALPIDQVKEVIAFREPRRVASRASWVRGVINLRGTIVPVCDLAARLGRDCEHAPSAKIVVVDVPSGPAGLIVDGVREVLTVGAEHLDRVTFTSDAAVTAIAKLGERLVVMLDAPAALEGADLGR
jgi:purine-binding chemotaxis protein CheW